MVPTERILGQMLTGGDFEVEVVGDMMTWSEPGAGHIVAFRSADGEPPPPTTVAPTSFDRLRCGPGIVIESRHAADGITPEELAKQIRPETSRVEPGRPLQWWGYDVDGTVVIGVFLGDVPDPDYQVVTCSG